MLFQNQEDAASKTSVEPDEVGSVSLDMLFTCTDVVEKFGDHFTNTKFLKKMHPLLNLINVFETQIKGKFLYSTLSSPEDCSKHFTLSFPGRPVQSNAISTSLRNIVKTIIITVDTISTIQQ